MPTWTCWRSTWCLIGSNRLVDMEPCNCSLPRDMNKHIYWTSRTVGMPPITISTTCHKKSPIRIAFLASEWERSICKPSHCVGRTVLTPAKCARPALSWLHPWSPSHMRSPNSWDLKTTVMESILTLWSRTSEHYSTLWKTQHTALH